MPGGGRGSARARRGHEEKPECGLKKIIINILTTSPPDAGLLRPRVRQQARRSGGGGGNVRRAQLGASAQVPTPPPGEGRPDSARPPGPGRETSRQSRGVQEATDSPETPVPSSPPCSRIQSSARPPNRPSPGLAPASTPPARPVALGRPATRRPLRGRPRLTSSRLRGQGRNNSAGLPRLTRRPALCGRARPVHSAAARALGGRREQGGGSGEGGRGEKDRPAGRGEGGDGPRRRRVGSARVRTPRRGVRAPEGGGAFSALGGGAHARTRPRLEMVGVGDRGLGTGK